MGEPITDLPRYDATTALSQPGRTLPDAPLLGGLTLDHYRIVKLLGKGGMGEVYLAQDTRLGHEVAIKVLPAALAQDPERIQRFEREARLLARLHHPHIATIHLLGQSGAVRYLVLEYVPGATLSERLEDGKLTAREALPLLRQLASALAHAHTQPEPIIHRDLKPDNLKLTASGEIKVLDFGLAKAVRSDFATAETADSTPLPVETFSTTHHVIQGTVPYMSPEQTLGQRQDQRTDWWAFGCIGFELLTGQRPFHSLSLDGMLKAINQDEPVWDRLPRETPPALRRLLQQCLQKEPQQRLANAVEAERWLEQAATELRKRKLGVPGFWSKAMLAGALTILAGVVVSLTPLRETARQFFAPSAPAPAPPAVTKPHLAVLPFRAGQPADARLGAGLSQMLRDSLAGSAELVVLPFADATQTEAQPAPADLLHNFGAQFLLEGEVTPTSAETLDVKLRLHKAQQPTLSDSVTGNRADFTALQTALLEKVQALLALKPSLPPFTRWFKQSAAQAQYLEALAYLQSDLTNATVEQPIQLLTKLTVSEPEATRAWAALAQAYLRKGQLTNQPRWLKEAESASTKALAREPNSSEAQLTRGYVLSALGNYEEAAKAFLQVLNQRPNELEARLGLAGVFEDKPDALQAETWYKQAATLWPNYWACYNELGAFYAEQGRYAEAHVALGRVLQLDPKNLSARINTGNALLKLGKLPEA
ncbi:MAG: protein kinase, partial [Acidobacteria bacterium]|nr:protein kinase [Acidobacteriota bacterium]